MACSSFPSLEIEEHDDGVSDDQFSQQQHRFDLNNTANILAGQAYSSGQEHLLPIANVGRIMKRALPPNAKISKQAKETVQECASEFIGFITAEAAGTCGRNNRKTLAGDDICSAMSTLGLDSYADAMRRYLVRYREHGEKRAAAASASSASIHHHRRGGGSDTAVASIDVVDELSVSKSKGSSSSSSTWHLFPTN